MKMSGAWKWKMIKRMEWEMGVQDKKIRGSSHDGLLWI
jgi:hypothetical protein